MAREAADDHADLAARLRNRVLTSGALDLALRARALAVGLGERPKPGPCGALAARVGGESSRVTDAQVGAVRDVLGSDVQAFELVLSAAVGAGLRRWDAAARAIDQVRDETP